MIVHQAVFWCPRVDHEEGLRKRAEARIARRALVRQLLGASTGGVKMTNGCPLGRIDACQTGP